MIEILLTFGGVLFSILLDVACNYRQNYTEPVRKDINPNDTNLN
jgi:hypothetical protein